MSQNRFSFFEENQSERLRRYTIENILKLKRDDLNAKVMSLIKENDLDMIDELLKNKFSLIEELDDDIGHAILKAIFSKDRYFFDNIQNSKIEESLMTLVTFDKNKIAIFLLQNIRKLFISSSLLSAASGQKSLNMTLIKLLCKNNNFIFLETPYAPSALSNAISRRHYDLITYFVNECSHYFSKDQLKITNAFLEGEYKDEGARQTLSARH